MASYQDIETRLQAVERKLEFALNTIQVGQRAGLIDDRVIVKTLLQIYYESQGAPQQGEIFEQTKPTVTENV